MVHKQKETDSMIAHHSKSPNLLISINSEKIISGH